MSLSKEQLEKAFPTTRSSPSKNFKKRQSRLRVSGQTYMTSSVRVIPAKELPQLAVTCKCRFECKDVEHSQKVKLFKEFHTLNNNEQGNYLMSNMTILNVNRRTTDEASSRRQCSVTFFVPKESGEFARVCKKTFMDIFGIKSSKKIENIVKKKKKGDVTYSDVRGGPTTYKFTKHDRDQVKRHIKSIPSEPSHYSRETNNFEYLSQDLNYSLLLRAFKKKHPASQVSLKFYIRVFKADFPNLRFRKPRVDTCRTCDVLNAEQKSPNKKLSKKAKHDIELHHRKVQSAKNKIQSDSASSTLPASDTCTVVIDLQKVFSLPKLTHSNMYYSRQLSCYNFGIHVCDTGESVMCLWHEGQGSRGGNEMASCLFQAFNHFHITHKKKLVIWSDNCCGQIKNRMMVFLYMYMVSSGMFNSIEHKFLVSGHSFSDADRDFALIEKRWKVSRAQVVNDVKKDIISARPSKPFKVLDMGNKFLNFDKASRDAIQTEKLKITQVSVLKVEINKPGIVAVKNSFNDLVSFTDINVCTRNFNVDLQDTIFEGLPTEIPLSDNKRKDILPMLRFIKRKNKPYYKKLLSLGHP